MALTDPRTAPVMNEQLYDALTFYRKTSSTGAIDYLPTVASPYPSNTTTQYGYSAAMHTVNDTAKVGAASDPLLGRVIRSEADSTCVIQVKGVMSFSFVNDATAPVNGRGVVCDGSGGVRIAASGSEWKERGAVIDLNTSTLICTVLVV